MKKDKISKISIDPRLNKYHGKILFPEKLAIAEEKIKGLKLPVNNKDYE